MEGSQRNLPPYAGGVRGGGVAPPAKVPLFASAFPQRQPSPPSSGFQSVSRREEEQNIDGNWPNNTSSNSNYSRGYGVNIPMGSIPALPGFPATSGFSPYIAPQQQQGVGGGEPGAPAQLNTPGNEFAVAPYQLQRKQQQPPFQSPPSKINPFPGDPDPPRTGAAPHSLHQRHHVDINFNSTANVSSAQPTRIGRPIQPQPANPTVPTSSMQPPNPIRVPSVHPQLPGSQQHQLPMYPTAFTAYGTGPRGGGPGVIQRQKPELVPPANWAALQTVSSSSHVSKADSRVPPARSRPPSPLTTTNSVSISVSPHPSTKPPQATPQVPVLVPPPTTATGGGPGAAATIGVASPPAPPSTQKIVYIPPSPAGAIIAKRFRTKLCGNFMQRGTCPFDQRCMFAHGEAELRSTNQNFRDGITTEEAIRQFQRGAPLPIVPTSTSAPAPTPASASDSVPPPPPAASPLQRESPIVEADPLRVEISPDESLPSRSTPPSTNPTMSTLPQPNLQHPRLPSPLAAGAGVRSLLSIYQRDDDRQTKLSSPGSQQQQQQPLPEEFIQTQSTSVLSDRSGSRLDSLSGSGIFASQHQQQSTLDQQSSPPTLTTGGGGGDLTSGVSAAGVPSRGSVAAARGTGRALSSPSFTNSGDVASESDPTASAPAPSGRLQRQRSSDGQAHYRRDPYAWNLRMQLEEEQERK
jgi:hypothetical protein